ncbi:MAG: hypothetical protein RRX95_07660, partial [Oscillospiraceae bacterium]
MGICAIAPSTAVIEVGSCRQYLSFYTESFIRKHRLLLPKNYVAKAIVFVPCGFQGLQNQFYILAVKQGRTVVLRWELPYCDMRIARCNFDICPEPPCPEPPCPEPPCPEQPCPKPPCPKPPCPKPPCPKPPCPKPPCPKPPCPKPPHPRPPKPQHKSCASVIESVALMEAALSHILNAEGEKLQKIIAATDDVDKILSANKIINEMVINATHLEIVLHNKLVAIKDFCVEKDDCKCHCEKPPCK